MRETACVHSVRNFCANSLISLISFSLLRVAKALSKVVLVKALFSSRVALLAVTISSKKEFLILSMARFCEISSEKNVVCGYGRRPDTFP